MLTDNREINHQMEKRVKVIAARYSRVLVGFAHYDNGVRVPGCDCCYCTQQEDEC